MKKMLIILGIACFLSGSFAPVIADEVQLRGVDKPKIEIPKNDYKKSDSLLLDDEQTMEQIVQLQREKDMEDIDNLWKGTVSNTIRLIGFALKKLSTPESQRRIHSSPMSKTLSAIISGASLAPTLLGARLHPANLSQLMVRDVLLKIF